jgi:PAS domain S-box-containing protein
MVDSGGQIVLVNRQIESMFGYSREELLGRPVEMLIPERFRAGHPDLRNSFFSDPRMRAMGAGRDLYGLRKDGAEVLIEIGLTPLVTDEGMFVLSSIVDIRERRRAEQLFRAAVESSPSGMLMIDRAGKIVLVNREIERMFGYPRTDLLGNQIEMLVPERFRAAHSEHRSAFLAGPEKRAMGTGRELFGHRKDGTEIPVEIGLNPVETDEGLFVLGSVVDISSRKRADEERRLLGEQLRHAQKMEAIGRLASGIAHDFKNILAGIIGCSRQVLRSMPSGDPAGDLVSEIQGAAERGASLSRQLLEFGRQRPSVMTPVRLNEVVQTSERLLRQIIGSDVSVDVDLSPACPPVLAEHGKLEQILMNLAVNARDAMPKGGHLRIATREAEIDQEVALRGLSLRRGHYSVLCVEDDGFGMDAATQEYVFEPFFTTKEAGQGTGLGLYTVYGIVQQLGGAIDFTSEPHGGTRFILYFPSCVSEESETTTSSKTPILRGRGETILLVEDERLIRATLRSMLEGLGYEVLPAASSDEATKIAQERVGPIHLLLTDIVLPGATGAMLAETLSESRKALRVLFMSALPVDVLVRQGRLREGDRCLEKPFEDEMLAKAIREELDPSR